MDSRLSEILEELKSSTIEHFLALTDLVTCVKFDARFPEGRGYLLGAGNNRYRIDISAHCDEHSKLIIFIHEVFHVPLLQEGFQYFDTATYWKVERALDEAAEIFLEQHSELVKERMGALSKTR